MKILFEWISRAFALALVVWVGALFFSPDKCTRVQRFGLPVIYFFNYVVSPLAEHWASPDTKLFILKVQYKSVLSVQQFFERTMYGVSTAKDSGGVQVDVYACTK